MFIFIYFYASVVYNLLIIIEEGFVWNCSVQKTRYFKMIKKNNIWKKKNKKQKKIKKTL